MTFQLVIDQYYDTSFINYAHQGMVKSLAKNREVEDAMLLSQNEQNGLRSLMRQRK